MLSKRNLVEKKAVLASLTEEKVVQVKGLVERKVLIEQRPLKEITLVMMKILHLVCRKDGFTSLEFITLVAQNAELANVSG